MIIAKPEEEIEDQAFQKKLSVSLKSTKFLSPRDLEWFPHSPASRLGDMSRIQRVLEFKNIRVVAAR